MEAPDDKALRRARRVLLGIYASVVPAFPLVIAFGVENAHEGFEKGFPELWRYIAAAVVSAPLGVFVLRLGAIRFGRLKGAERRTHYTAYALLAAAFLLVAPYHPRDPQFFTGMLLGMWWAAVALSLPRRRLQATLMAVPLVLVPLAAAPFTADGAWDVMVVQSVGIVWGSVIGGGAFAALTSGLMTLWDLFEQAVEGREARARLAASEERLRIARDMHDILGHSLSGIAVKSQLASRLVGRDPGAAKQEMASVQATAREALAEVRSAVAGYREADLAVEARSVCDALRAAGAACSVDIDEDVPVRLSGAAAWVVREAGTNALRHSDARRFSVAVRRGGAALVVEVANDGVPRGTAGSAVNGGGSGLAGMRERVAGVGGTLTAGPDGVGGFLVRAEFPEGVGADGAACAVEGGGR
ncbi:sensor histidine kinase [Nocardiopsis suaedae]|uniref:histidine kinase n=1 Tax=Nocardiopsis suaedae TaxID=3018444 RepID=A0ABT4TNP5_9ACTN|nr:sensor histidine kinase [Nocardiopsis suaedae]MDA2806308.1 sensor histidine kinase [Nocardiopsis suaedae]